MTTELFDPLADDYDAARPRYPVDLLSTIADHLPDGRTLRVLDAAAGTGIALEGLIPLLGDRHDYTAIDISEGMTDLGRRKLPEVHWRVEPVEPVLERLHAELDLVTVAQAIHWLDRERFLRATRGALRGGGVLAVLRNDRLHTEDAFLNAYEDLLESRSPGYRRGHRILDLATELTRVFGDDSVTLQTTRWTQTCTVDDFVRLAASTTPVQAADPELLTEIRALAADAAADGDLRLPYLSRLALARRS